MSDESKPNEAVANAPLTEEQLLAVTVGERTPLNNTIRLDEYDPTWPQHYEGEVAAIRDLLGDKMLPIEHVGSTSVPGLAAKPIIDILLVVADSADEPAYIAPLESAGYALRIRETEWHQHRLLKGPHTNINLHVFSSGCSEIERMLRFRDWLRSNESDRQLYECTKRRLAAKTWQYTQNYADAKAEVVEEVIARARAAHESAS
ncbi:MAG: GrpB family protein [Thermomicrobiales bacterium]